MMNQDQFHSAQSDKVYMKIDGWLPYKNITEQKDKNILVEYTNNSQEHNLLHTNEESMFCYNGHTT